jgi:hypothetical protein
MLLANEVADPVCVEECDAGETDRPDDPRPGASVGRSGTREGGLVIVISEAHGLKPEVIRALLVALERVPSRAIWCLTTTAEGKETLFGNEDSSPLLTRWVRLELAHRNLAKPFAERAQQIARAEGLDGLPIERYVKLLQECRNNLRAALQAVRPAPCWRDLSVPTTREPRTPVRSAGS